MLNIKDVYSILLIFKIVNNFDKYILFTIKAILYKLIVGITIIFIATIIDIK